MHCLSGSPLYGKKQRLFSKFSQISFVYAAQWPIICTTSGKVNNAKHFNKLLFFTSLIPIRVQDIYLISNNNKKKIRASRGFIFLKRLCFKGLTEVRMKIDFTKKNSSYTISYPKITSRINVHIHTFRLRYFSFFKSILGKILNECLRCYVGKKGKVVRIYIVKNTCGNSGVSYTYWLHSSTRSKSRR